MFDKFATRVSHYAGSSWAFIAMLVVVLSWLLTGPFFRFSNTHSLFINTVTTITTGLLVFIIQNTQNRDNKALHLKLDEIIRAIDQAHNELIEAEQRDSQWLEQYSVKDHIDGLQDEGREDSR